MTPKSPRYKLSSGGIQKSVTNTITFEPSSADGRSNSDIELVDTKWRDRD